MSTPVVEHLPAENRFVIRLEGHEAELTWRRSATALDFLHTGVPDALGGRGIGSALARAGLDFARAEGLTVRPWCPFIAGWIARHPEYADLVAADFEAPA